MNILQSAVRFYLSYFPVEKGKWSVFERLRARLHADGASTAPVVRRLPLGFSICLYRQQYIDNFIYYWNCWDPNETWLLGKLLRRGDVFLDIGANVGYFTLLASSLVGAQGKVCAVEACPPTAERLRQNLGLNSAQNVDVYEIAASDSPGTVRIGKLFEGNWGSNSIRGGNSSLETWEVPAVPIDDVIPESVCPAVVKMDIEGAELHALRGMRRILSGVNAPDVICEVTDAYLRETGGSSDDLYHLMEEYGYRGFSFERKRIAPVSPSELRAVSQMNVLFSKKSPPGVRS